MIENALDPPPDPDDEFDRLLASEKSQKVLGRLADEALRDFHENRPTPAPPVPANEREQILERLLRNLLEEVGMRDGMGRISKKFCMGCVKKNPKMLRACVAARKFLDG